MTADARNAEPAGRDGSKAVKRNKPFDLALGARIRALRIAAEMSQAGLGRAVGISFQQVQKYEAGKNRVAASILQGFAAVLGVHPGSFFDEDMPAPTGSVSDKRAAMKAGAVLQRMHDPRVLRQLLALAEALAGEEGRSDEGPGSVEP